MAEGPDLAQLEELTGKIADVVKQELGSNWRLPEITVQLETN